MSSALSRSWRRNLTHAGHIAGSSGGRSITTHGAPASTSIGGCVGSEPVSSTVSSASAPTIHVTPNPSHPAFTASRSLSYAMSPNTFPTLQAGVPLVGLNLECLSGGDDGRSRPGWQRDLGREITPSCGDRP